MFEMLMMISFELSEVDLFHPHYYILQSSFHELAVDKQPQVALAGIPRQDFRFAFAPCNSHDLSYTILDPRPYLNQTTPAATVLARSKGR